MMESKINIEKKIQYIVSQNNGPVRASKLFLSHSSFRVLFWSLARLHFQWETVSTAASAPIIEQTPITIDSTTSMTVAVNSGSVLVNFFCDKKLRDRLSH